MVGQTLINRIRQMLRDPDDNSVTSVTRGVFWTDNEILAVLNACQYSFINFCLSQNYYKDLHLLMTNVGLSGQWDTLPTDYLHYQSARVSKFSFDVPAKIYLGGDGVGYLGSDLEAMIIIGNRVSVRVGRNFGLGTLFYYKRPSQITIGSFIDSFKPDIYRLISDYTITVLGMKEIQTSRDLKMKKKLVEELAMQPMVFANYIQDKESIIKPKKEQANG